MWDVSEQRLGLWDGMCCDRCRGKEQPACCRVQHAAACLAGQGPAGEEGKLLQGLGCHHWRRTAGSLGCRCLPSPCTPQPRSPPMPCLAPDCMFRPLTWLSSVLTACAALPVFTCNLRACLSCSPTVTFPPLQGQKLSLSSSITGTLVSSVGKWLDRGLTAMLGGGEAGKRGGCCLRGALHCPSTDNSIGRAAGCSAVLLCSCCLYPYPCDPRPALPSRQRGRAAFPPCQPLPQPQHQQCGRQQGAGCAYGFDSVRRCLHSVARRGRMLRSMHALRGTSQALPATQIWCLRMARSALPAVKQRTVGVGMAGLWRSRTSLAGRAASSTASAASPAC